MKRSTSTLLRLFLMLCISLVFTLPLISQEISKEEITEGKEYWFGLPHCNREAGEAIRGAYAIAIWISSKVDTRATVEDAETGSIKNFVIRANEITEVPYGDNIMMTVSEEIKKFGIHVTADDPISVAVYMSYRWSGEAYRVTPVEWLGKKYVTLNMYQDKTDKLLPAQILIVSSDDNNVIKYRPTANTVKIDAGKLGQVTLQKGDCYLIEGRPNAGLIQDWVTDLSGTYIESTKPIAVISGHTKSGFPRVQSTMLGRPTNFMKNMMIDMMWPIELLGTEYVAAPFRYAARPRGVYPEDAGDLMRFVAAYDSTVIEQLRKDGSSFMKISRVLKRGEYHDIVSQEVAAMYRANRPVLVGQYGKTWMDHVPTPIADKGKTDEPQNPSSNGQGMLITLAPIDHWTSYAAFRAPASIDNFVYLTFDSRDLNKFKFDGTSFLAKFGSSVKYIAGTNYAWLATEVSPGDHVIIGDTIMGGKDKAKFAGYAYGNWDRSKDGFAYGYPIGINYNSTCEDSLYIKDNMVCGNVDAQVFVTPPTADCAGLLSINFKSSESFNYNFSTSQFNPGDKTAQYFLDVIDLQKPAKGVVTVMTRSGRILKKTYEYTPEQISVVPVNVEFGLMKVGQKVCKTFTISNPGTAKLTVKNLRLKYGKSEFAITTKDILPIELEPGQTKEVEVCATALVNQTVAVNDSIIADLSCYSKNIVYLRLTTGEPIVTITDANWVDIPLGNEESRSVKIINKSNINVELYTIDWADKVHFTKVEGLTFPLILEPSQQFDFLVYYKPDKIGVQDVTRANFTGNTDKDKLYSDWVGNGIEPGPRIFGYDWKERRVIDTYAQNHGVTNYPHFVVLADTTGNSKVDVTDVIIENDPDGVFSLDRAQIPTQLQIGQIFNLPAFFAPKAEKEYISKVTLICQFNGKEIRVSDQLRGVGIQPHINIIGKDFTPAILVGASLDDKGEVLHVTNVNPMELTVTSLSIDGPDKDAFVIDPAFLADNSKWNKVAIGGQFDVPIKFTAKHPGLHEAQLTAVSDAPENPIGALTGMGFTEGLMSNNHDHGTLFVSQMNDGQVFLTNTGSTPLTITRDIRASVTGDDKYFYIKGWQTAKSGIKDQSSFDVNPGDTVYVDVQFTLNFMDINVVDQQPNNIKDLKATIEYLTTGGKAYSYLTGKAQILKTIARIPKNKYRVDPGSKTEIEFFIDKDSDEAKALASGSIQEFKAQVIFKSEGRQNIQDVYPSTVEPNDTRPFGVKDIITNGTMTQGWEIVPEMQAGAKDTLIADNSKLTVHFKNSGQPLNFTGTNGLLFKFKMNTYLSDLDIIPLRCVFSVLGPPSLYTIVDTIPGDIAVNPVCVNTLRLIKLSGTQYSLAQATPNPAGTFTTINYSVGLEAQTTISLFNINGEKVATLINANLKPGDYELKVDVNGLNLSSGAYQYRIESGPFSETRSLIISK